MTTSLFNREIAFLFGGRPWVANARVEDTDMEEIERWIDDQGMDCLCQGVMQGTPSDGDDKHWYSIWSFGNDQDRTMFVLRFGG